MVSKIYFNWNKIYSLRRIYTATNQNKYFILPGKEYYTTNKIKARIVNGQFENYYDSPKYAKKVGLHLAVCRNP